MDDCPCPEQRAHLGLGSAEERCGQLRTLRLWSGHDLVPFVSRFIHTVAWDGDMNWHESVEKLT